MKKSLNSTPGVTLQRRKLKDGRISLYLHIQQKGKKAERQWLRLYLVGDAAADSRTLAIADEVRKQRFLEMQINPDADYTRDAIAYFRHYAARRKRKDVFDSTIRHLLLFTGKETLSFSAINRSFCERFLRYLTKQNLRSSSVAVYWTTFKSVLNEAVRDNYLVFNPCTSVRGIKSSTRERSFLTFEELQVLAYTPCKNEEVKRAFLFSAWTGLRFSDLKNLKWFNVGTLPNGEPALIYTQQKTGVTNYVPLPTTAIALLDDGKGHVPTDHVFTIPCKQRVHKTLIDWGKAAGLQKHIHFHLARHSFATLTLAQGVDLYTVSSLLGHTSIKQTETYAKVVNASKMKAVATLPTLALPQRK